MAEVTINLAEPPRNGRPSDFKDEYCEQVVEFCAQGYTLTAWCAEIDRDRGTVQRWQDQVPKFRIACMRARHRMQRWWEDKLRHGVSDKGYNANAILNTLGVLTEDFRPPSQRMELTGADGGPLQISRSCTDEQLRRLAAQVLDVEHTPLPAPEPQEKKGPDQLRDKLVLMG